MQFEGATIWCIWSSYCTPHEPPQAAPSVLNTKGLPSGLEGGLPLTSKPRRRRVYGCVFFLFLDVIMSFCLYYLLVFDLNLDKMSKILSHMYVNRSRVYATTMQRTRPVHHCCWRMWQCTKSITLETRAFCNTDMHKTQQIGTRTCTMPSMYHVDMQLFSECIMDMKLWMV